MRAWAGDSKIHSQCHKKHAKKAGGRKWPPRRLDGGLRRGLDAPRPSLADRAACLVRSSARSIQAGQRRKSGCSRTLPPEPAAPVHGRSAASSSCRVSAITAGRRPRREPPTHAAPPPAGGWGRPPGAPPAPCPAQTAHRRPRREPAPLPPPKRRCGHGPACSWGGNSPRSHGLDTTPV